MKILVIGTPKRGADFYQTFDNVIFGLSAIGMPLDHFPDIVAQNYGGIADYETKYRSRHISYPDYQSILDRIKKGYYDLVITTICRMDYNAGKHGLLSRLAREFKYSLEANKHKLGGTLVADWIRQGLKLPTLVVVDYSDDSFIWPVDSDLLFNCSLYFKRELPFDRFFPLRLFDSRLTNEEKAGLAEKMRPIWMSYDKDLMERFVDADRPAPLAGRDIDVSFLCDIYTNYERIRVLPELEKLGKEFKVVTAKDGKLSKPEFFKCLSRSKIGISLPGRGWDCVRHHELLLSGALLFVTRPRTEFAVPFKDGENCVFIESDLSDFNDKLRFYLGNPSVAQEVAGRGNELARRSMHNGKLAEYIVETALKAVGADAR